MSIETIQGESGPVFKALSLPGAFLTGSRTQAEAHEQRGVELGSLLEKLRALTPEQWAVVSTTRETVRFAEARKAWITASTEAASAGRAEALSAMVDEAGLIATIGSANPMIACAAAPAAGEAVRAVIARDLISDDYFKALINPVAAVVDCVAAR